MNCAKFSVGKSPRNRRKARRCCVFPVKAGALIPFQDKKSDFHESALYLLDDLSGVKASATLSTKDGEGGSETLKGWGVGATYSKENDWYARVDYARRIGSPEVMSRDAQSRERFRFFAGKVF